MKGFAQITGHFWKFCEGVINMTIQNNGPKRHAWGVNFKWLKAAEIQV